MSTLALQPHFTQTSRQRAVQTGSVNHLLDSTKKMKLKVAVLFELLKKDKKTRQVLEVLDEQIAYHQDELSRIEFLQSKSQRADLTLTNIIAHDIIDHASHLAEVNVKITGDVRSRMRGDFELLSSYMNHLFSYIKNYLSLDKIEIDIYRSQGFVKLDFHVPLPLMLDDKMLKITERTMKVHFGKQTWLGGRLLLALPSTNT